MTPYRDFDMSKSTVLGRNLSQYHNNLLHHRMTRFIISIATVVVIVVDVVFVVVVVVVVDGTC